MVTFAWSSRDYVSASSLAYYGLDHVIAEFKKESSLNLRAKIELLSISQMEVNLPPITADASGPKHINMKLWCIQLENLVEPLIKCTVDPCKKALSDAGLQGGQEYLRSQAPTRESTPITVGGAVVIRAPPSRVSSVFPSAQSQSISHSPPLEESNSESITTQRTPSVPTHNAFTDDPDSGSEYAAGEETDDDEDEWSDDTAGMYDFVTERNAEQNALIATHASSRDSSFANLLSIIPA
ncbi:HSP70-domain-containing protein [Rhizopogon salebrosus TDB-379]|nr:HSP70-domain-containing protein [Rhizopogon salebrosus TDB-379]